MKVSAAVLAARYSVYALLVLGAGLTLVPLLWLAAATLKGPDDLFHHLFFPPVNRLTLVNFSDLFHKVDFLRYLVNSTFVSCTVVITQLFFSSLAGFALAKYEFKGKRAIMVLMLATMLIPGQVVLAPLYELIYNLHLVDTYQGLIGPGIVSVFGIFLFRQSILQVPDELLHAARIDGCSEFRAYWSVVMPVSRPMIGAFCLIAFLGAWNSFLWPQIILHHDERFTLPIAMNALMGTYQQEYGTLMAGTFLSIVPVVILFLALQKEFVAGLTAGAVKG